VDDYVLDTLELISFRASGFFPFALFDVFSVCDSGYRNMWGYSYQRLYIEWAGLLGDFVEITACRITLRDKFRNYGTLKGLL
jgi:hypothetical protein